LLLVSYFLWKNADRHALIGVRRLRLEFEQRIVLIHEALLALGNGL
jgi:hypothetical protein